MTITITDSEMRILDTVRQAMLSRFPEVTALAVAMGRADLLDSLVDKGLFTRSNGTYEFTVDGLAVARGHEDGVEIVPDPTISLATQGKNIMACTLALMRAGERWWYRDWGNIVARARRWPMLHPASAMFIPLSENLAIRYFEDRTALLANLNMSDPLWVHTMHDDENSLVVVMGLENAQEFWVTKGTPIFVGVWTVSKDDGLPGALRVMEADEFPLGFETLNRRYRITSVALSREDAVRESREYVFLDDEGFWAWV